MALGDSSNPVSPKVVAAGIGSLLGPLILAVVTTVVDLVLLGNVQLPEPWNTVAFIVASGLGAVIAAYRKTDGLRLPTINEAEVAKLNPTPVNE
jgi:hypothetical protein